MGDPVSWFVVEPGWSVVDNEGTHVGSVIQVVGDPNVDIFDGLSVRRGSDVLKPPTYVPSEHVGAIEQGTVHLTVDAAAVDGLPPYEAPRQPGP